jgi:hypothetical protein
MPRQAQATPDQSGPNADRTRLAVCACCELDFPAWLADDEADDTRGWRCADCGRHRGDELAMVREHERELRLRLSQATEDLAAETHRANDYRRKMQAAARSRDHVLAQFARLARHHRATEHGCICGKRNCETLTVIDADWINDRIAAMYRLG